MYREVTHYSTQEDVFTAVGGCQSNIKYTSMKEHGDDIYTSSQQCVQTYL